MNIVMIMKQTVKIILIPSCIFSQSFHKQCIHFQQNEHHKYLYLYSSPQMLSPIPLHLQHRFAEQTFKIYVTMKKNFLFVILLVLLFGCSPVYAATVIKKVAPAFWCRRIQILSCKRSGKDACTYRTPSRTCGAGEKIW